jgi:hypothetical protein
MTRIRIAKPKTHRDPAWLRELRNRPCLFTGQLANDQESVVPAHIGTAGKGVKAHDYWAIPVTNSVHQRMHNEGEITVLRQAPADVIRAAFRALAKEMYEDG